MQKRGLKLTMRLKCGQQADSWGHYQPDLLFLTAFARPCGDDGTGCTWYTDVAGTEKSGVFVKEITK